MIKSLKFNLKNNKPFSSKGLAFFVLIVLNLTTMHAFGAQNCSSYLNFGHIAERASNLSHSPEDLPVPSLRLTPEDLLPTNTYYYLSRDEDQIRKDLNLPSKMRVQFTDNEQILLSTPGLPFLVLERKYPDGNVIFRLPKGLRYRAKLQKKLLNIWNDDWTLTDIQALPSEIPLTFRPNPKSKVDLNIDPIFLHQQALRQLQYSTTFKASKNELDKFSQQQAQALLYLLELLKNKKYLEISDLNRVNSLLITETNLRRSDVTELHIGNIRGSSSKELRHIEIQELAAGLQFLNPTLVPQEMMVLISKINLINQDTTLQEIAKIYQDFIFIHPYIDGNGRTSRVLLDYMLLKASFNFANHKGNISIILSQTIQELAANLALNLLP
jgi:hypothetical protein